MDYRGLSRIIFALGLRVSGRYIHRPRLSLKFMSDYFISFIHIDDSTRWLSSLSEYTP
jgi:hypothetical protein